MPEPGPDPGPAGVAEELNRLLLQAERRRGRTLDRPELARRLNVSPASLYAYLNGTTLPRGPVFERLLDALDVRGAKRGRLCTLRDSVEITHRMRITGPGRTPDRPAIPRPWQVPPPPAALVGRAAELTWLDDVAANGGTPAAPLAVLSGTAGVGKTALALHWAHHARERFPDGQLYVDLQGFAPGTPIDSGVALHGFLHALGVPPVGIPPATAARSGLLRSILDDRRTLVLLDNARSTEQVRPLLAGGSGCMVLVTGRTRLDGLVVHHGAHRRGLDLLSATDGAALVAARIDGRLAPDSRVARLLAEACAGLPLALGVLAARITDRPGQPAAVVTTELRAERDRLLLTASPEDDLDLRSVLGWSYDVLSPDAARLFRLIGVHPGPDLDGPACAALLGRPQMPVEALRELLHASLLTERVLGRYQLHDLLRAFARVRSDQQDDDEDRDTALRRVFDHYLAMASTADEHLRSVTPGFDPATRTGALRWFETEWTVLNAVIRHDVARRNTHAAELARVSTVFLRRTGRYAERVDVHRIAVDVALRSARRPVLATALRLLADAQNRVRPGGGADRTAAEALAIVTELGDLDGMMRAHLAVARACRGADRLGQAGDHARTSLALAVKIGDRVAEADARTELSRQAAGNHCPDEARRLAERALADYVRLGHREGEAATLKLIGDAAVQLGRPADAVAAFTRSLAVDRELGDDFWAARAAERLEDARAGLDERDGTASGRR